MPDFRKALADTLVYCVDGAYGTLLQSRGQPSGTSPELWGLHNPDVVRQAHADYFAAGARLLTTNTFGGSELKLGPDADPEELNRRMAQIAREVAGDNAFVAGSVGPTGKFIAPMGEMTFREMVEVFKRQIRGLAQGGADLIKAETHFDLAELRAVVVAAREVCDLPVLACMTFEPAGATLTGTTPQVFADTMQNMGVEAVGMNCGLGPEDMRPMALAMRGRLSIPFYVQPNAGLPELVDGETVFRLSPDDFAAENRAFLADGAKMLGGCCGTTPEHIRALSSILSDQTWQRPEPEEPSALVLTTRSRSVPIGVGRRAVCIGERINPTGKKKLTEELQAGVFGEALRLAEEQIAQGAEVLDVNVGAPMVDEGEVLPRLVLALSERFQTPLCLDTSSPEAMAEALWNAPGSSLVNSISGDEGRLEEIGPLCKKFGAPFILLPLAGKRLPVAASERIAIIEDVLARAEALGIPRSLILVDALALTVSSKPEAALACMEVMRHCRDNLGLPTTLGLSNISFGLPARPLVNSSFMAMALAAGLSSFIANPGSARLMETAASAEVLLGRDPQAERFIAGYGAWEPGEAAVRVAGGGESGGRASATVREAVVRGDKDRVTQLLDEALASGRDPFEVVSAELVAGIMEVGDKYERKEYFLPQLMLSAETMQKGFDHVRPLLEEDADKVRDTVVMATVEGDIHDIGKNIVCLLLKNHGFEVVDLGKDVSAERIVDAAEKHGACVVGLSALMTTTMVRMKDVVDLARERSLKARILVGGAVVTEEFARTIGADGYAEDAVAAARLAAKFVGK